MRVTYVNNVNMARRTEIRALVLPSHFRAAIGAQARIIRAKRLEVMDSTIYRRGPDRGLSGNLRRMEYVQPSGSSILVGNKAPYAQWRNDRRGRSRKWGHEMQSNWAGRAIAETRVERRRLMREAVKAAYDAGKVV